MLLKNDMNEKSLWEEAYNNINDENYWQYYNIIADYYSDSNQDNEYNFQNWLLTNKYKPYISSDTKEATWFNKEGVSPGLGDPESDLPAEVFNKLQGGEAVANHKKYKTFDEAIVAAFNAWKN